MLKTISSVNEIGELAKSISEDVKRTGAGFYSANKEMQDLADELTKGNGETKAADKETKKRSKTKPKAPDIVTRKGVAVSALQEERATNKVVPYKTLINALETLVSNDEKDVIYLENIDPTTILK